jgi:hypothetical protein
VRSVACFWFRKKGENTLQFQIKGQDYFLTFVEGEKRWFVFSPRPQGMLRLPVYVDAVKYERAGILEERTRDLS